MPLTTVRAIYTNGLLALCFISMFTSSASAQETIASVTAETGTVCISPIPKISDAGKTTDAKGYTSFAFTVQIDDGTPVPTSPKWSPQITSLDLSKRHLIKIRNEGKLVESFWFSFKSRNTHELCLWFNTFYQTWSLSRLQVTFRLCPCRESSGGEVPDREIGTGKSGFPPPQE